MQTGVVSPKESFDHSFQNYPIDRAKMYGSGLAEESQEQKHPYGRSLMKQWSFDGIRILHTQNHFNKKYIFENKNRDDVVSLEFNLKGRYNILHAGRNYEVNHNQHNIVYSPGTDNLFENHDLHTETFKVDFDPELFLHITSDSNHILRRFVDQMQSKHPAVLSASSGIIDLQLFNAINEILHCSFQGGIKKTFLLSKCLEILVLQAESFSRTEDPKHIYITRKDDLERLEYVRTFLHDHIDVAPSLRELSKISGLNEYKLKRGFKEAYGTTVFGYLNEARLNTARQRLQSGTHSIAEISYDLGYSSPQHFSKSFKEKFGMPPKAVSKKI
ncbi:MAG TPA: AraC family transcriptional regulator [Bacteroidales bacterium]|nr:AraC family transcriptional regulator [Bacteroidales bacterium]